MNSQTNQIALSEVKNIRKHPSQYTGDMSGDVHGFNKPICWLRRFSRAFNGFNFCLRKTFNYKEMHGLQCVHRIVKCSGATNLFLGTTISGKNKTKTPTSETKYF